MDKSAIETLLERIDIWLLIFGILVVIGVAGESFFGIRHWWNSRKLQTIQRIEELNLQVEIARLNKQAGDALEQAGKAEENLAGANARSATANERAAKAEQSAAEANRTAESERLARVQLQKELQPRRLTSVQKDKLTSLLRDKPKPIFILTMGDDTETADLANDIGDALNKAGWKTFFSVRFSFEHGIEVGTSRESDMPVLMPAIEELKSALSTVGLSSRTTLFDPNDNHLAGRFEKNVLSLVIDYKPVIKAPE